MRRRKPLFIVLCAVSGTFMFMCFIALIIISSIRVAQYSDYEYFGNTENYEQIECSINSVERVNNGSLVFRLEPVEDKFYLTTFTLKNENFVIAKQNGLLSELETNTIIDVWVAKYRGFYGWEDPIAGITYNGTEYLSFEDGYKNISQNYYYSYEATNEPLIAFGVILFIALSVFVANFIIFFTGKSPTKSDETAAAQPSDGEK